METVSSSSSSSSAQWTNVISLFLLRPLLAVSFVLSILLIGWMVAWKLVLVRVPLVQEIFGLRKKPKKERPPTRRRFAQIYNSINEAGGVQSSPS